METNCNIVKIDWKNAINKQNKKDCHKCQDRFNCELLKLILK